jgi:hypothetical protein
VGAESSGRGSGAGRTIDDLRHPVGTAAHAIPIERMRARRDWRSLGIGRPLNRAWEQPSLAPVDPLARGMKGPRPQMWMTRRFTSSREIRQAQFDEADAGPGGFRVCPFCLTSHLTRRATSRRTDSTAISSGSAISKALPSQLHACLLDWQQTDQTTYLGLHVGAASFVSGCCLFPSACSCPFALPTPEALP